MNDWVVESPSFEEQLMNNRIVYLNQEGINEVVELIKRKDTEIEKLNNILDTLEDSLEREINIKEEDLHIEHNTYIDKKETLEKVLKHLRELKEKINNDKFN